MELVGKVNGKVFGFQALLESCCKNVLYFPDASGCLLQKCFNFPDASGGLLQKCFIFSSNTGNLFSKVNYKNKYI